MAQSSLLLRARLQLSEVYPIVELSEFFLCPKLDSIQFPRIVAKLLLNFSLRHSDMTFYDKIYIFLAFLLRILLFLRYTVSFKRVSAVALGFAPILIVIQRVTLLKLDTLATFW